MARFIEGEDRRQSWLLPSSLDDYVAEDNSVRVVEAGLRSGDAPQTLPLRISEPRPVQPPIGARGAAQRRGHVADGAPGARPQDDRFIPPRQRTRDPGGMPAVRGAVPRARTFCRSGGGHRRIEV